MPTCSWAFMLACVPGARPSTPPAVEVASKYSTVETLRQQYMFVPAKHKDCYLAFVLTGAWPAQLAAGMLSSNAWAPPALRRGAAARQARRAPCTPSASPLPAHAHGPPCTPPLPPAELAGSTSIIFTRTCDSTRKLALMLRNLGFGAVPIHGQMSQPKRLAALNKFKVGGGWGMEGAGGGWRCAARFAGMQAQRAWFASVEVHQADIGALAIQRLQALERPVVRTGSAAAGRIFLLPRCAEHLSPVPAACRRAIATSSSPPTWRRAASTSPRWGGHGVPPGAGSGGPPVCQAHRAGPCAAL